MNAPPAPPTKKAFDLAEHVAVQVLESLMDRHDIETEKAIRSGSLLSGDHPLSPQERHVEADRFAHNARIEKRIRELERQRL
jgi:hypothetical protein